VNIDGAGLEQGGYSRALWITKSLRGSVVRIAEFDCE